MNTTIRRRFTRMAETDFEDTKFAATFAVHVKHRFINLSKLRLMVFIPAPKSFKSFDEKKLHFCHF